MFTTRLTTNIIPICLIISVYVMCALPNPLSCGPAQLISRMSCHTSRITTSDGSISYSFVAAYVVSLPVLNKLAAQKLQSISFQSSGSISLELWFNLTIDPTLVIILSPSAAICSLTLIYWSFFPRLTYRRKWSYRYPIVHDTIDDTPSPTVRGLSTWPVATLGIYPVELYPLSWFCKCISVGGTYILSPCAI